MAMKKTQKGIHKKTNSTVGTMLNIAGSDDALYFDVLYKKLYSVLMRGVEKFFTCDNLLLPKSTLTRAAQDIIRLSSCGHNGLRGTLIELYIRSETYSVRIAKIVADANTSPSTLLKLTLDEDRKAVSPSTLALRKGYTIERCVP